MGKHSDIQTVKDNLNELFSMIEYKKGDKYIQSMKQYLVNPMAWFITEDMVKQSLQAELAKANEKVNYMKGMGLEFGIMKTSNKPEGFLQHTYREGSSMHKGQQELLHAMTSNIDNEALQAELLRWNDKVIEISKEQVQTQAENKALKDGINNLATFDMECDGARTPTQGECINKRNYLKMNIAVIM